MSTKLIKTFDEKNLNDLQKELSKVEKNHPIKNHTWMKVGGAADLFFQANNTHDLIRAIKLSIENKIPYTILGGGSNIVVRDGGIRGLVIKNKANNISVVGVKGGVKNNRVDTLSAKVKAESGAIINHLVRYTLEESLQGLEEFLGVPGTVGGAVYNNSHHLDHLIGSYISQVEVIDKEANIKTYSNDQMKFSYDYSIVQDTGEVVISATFDLKKGNKDELWKAAEAALKRRRDTQPLEIPSSGCMFKNIGKAQALSYKTPNHSTSAGLLIDKSGLKGEKIGGAEVSDVHANFITNKGGATAEDIDKLATLVADRVKEKYGVTLEREVFFIGDK
ncbi:UDP-N-acetylmuramate dehydrogenase [Patescibacteria group bacterium]